MNRTSLWTLQVLAAAALVAGCGGGDGGGSTMPDAPPPAAPSALDGVPPSASSSDAQMAAYLGQLAQQNKDAESREPLDVSHFAPPTPDDAEPEPVS